MKVLAIDPGERVGWAHALADWVSPCGRVVQEGDRLPKGVKPEDMQPHLTITGHGISELKPFGLKINGVFGDYDVVIYESWRLAAGKAAAFAGNDMKSSQLIGMIRLSSWQNPKTKLVEQRPGNMKTGAKVATPEIQAILDKLPKAHDDSHDGSALLHLSYWFFKNYTVPKETA